MNDILQRRSIILSLAVLSAVLILSACGGQDTADSATSTQYFLNPYKEECQVGGDLRLCYVASVGDTGDFSPYEGQIENFDYEWGYGYALSGSGDENSFRVDEVLNKTAEKGGVQFQLVITGGGDRIAQGQDDTYMIYGEKAFVCDPSASCDTLDNVITREEPITFQFQTPDDPADPYLLLEWSSQSAAAQVGEEPALVGNNWLLQSFTADKDVQEPALSGTDLTASFTLDDSFASGTISGSGGCNDYTASVTISGNSMAIEDLEKGEAQCSDPPGIMEQEQRFVSALMVADSYSIDGERLQIIYDSGNSKLNFVVDKD